MSSRFLVRVIVLSWIPFAALLLGAGCSRSESPKAEQAKQAEPQAAEQDLAPRQETPPVPATSEPEDSSDPAMQSPPAVDVTINDLEETPSEDAAAAETEPVSSPEDDGGIRPNPLREGQMPGEASHVTLPEGGISRNSEATEPARPLRKGKHSGVKFDPVKENGEIFENWPKPQLAMLISGRQDGYIEPCGCAGLDRMKGGLTRRHTLAENLRADGWPLVAVDVGGQCKTFGRQSVLKYQMTAEALKQIGYDAVAYGTNDLRLPAGEVLAVTAATPDQKTAFISANAALFGFAAEMTPKRQIVEAGGFKVGITAVLGKKYQKEINNPDIEMSDPEKALSKLVPELKKESDLLVLLAHTTMEEAVALGKSFPEFKIVVVYGGTPEQPNVPQTIPGTDNLLVEVGEKGMNVVVLGFYDDPKNPIRYQRVPLDSRFASSPAMKLLMANYQSQLRSEGLQGLGLRPVSHPRKDVQGKFVGSQKCEACHEASYKVWKKTGHAQAWATLKNADPPRDADPECISCHVVGWHGTQFFPYESGFLSEQETPKLTDVGCESCHGPGEKHIAAEAGNDEALQRQHREAMVVTKEESEKHQCYTCHDLDNSPDFDFKDYWPYVEHREE